jgi:hypothetical protein
MILYITSIGRITARFGVPWSVQIALQPLTGFWIHDVKAASPISGGPVFSMSIRSF